MSNPSTVLPQVSTTPPFKSPENGRTPLEKEIQSINTNLLALRDTLGQYILLKNQDLDLKRKGLALAEEREKRRKWMSSESEEEDDSSSFGEIGNEVLKRQLK